MAIAPFVGRCAKVSRIDILLQLFHRKCIRRCPSCGGFRRTIFGSVSRNLRMSMGLHCCFRLAVNEVEPLLRSCRVSTQVLRSATGEVQTWFYTTESLSRAVLLGLLD